MLLCNGRVTDGQDSHHQYRASQCWRAIKTVDAAAAAKHNWE